MDAVGAISGPNNNEKVKDATVGLAGSSRPTTATTYVLAALISLGSLLLLGAGQSLPDVFYRYARRAEGRIRLPRCSLESGEWRGETVPFEFRHPSPCSYAVNSLSDVTRLFGGKRIVLVGDSYTRQLMFDFHGIANRCPDAAVNDKYFRSQYADAYYDDWAYPGHNRSDGGHRPFCKFLRSILYYQNMRAWISSAAELYPPGTHPNNVPVLGPNSAAPQQHLWSRRRTHAMVYQRGSTHPNNTYVDPFSPGGIVGNASLLASVNASSLSGLNSSSEVEVQPVRFESWWQPYFEELPRMPRWKAFLQDPNTVDAVVIGMFAWYPWGIAKAARDDLNKYLAANQVLIDSLLAHPRNATLRQRIWFRVLNHCERPANASVPVLFRSVESHRAIQAAAALWQRAGFRVLNMTGYYRVAKCASEPGGLCTTPQLTTDDRHLPSYVNLVIMRGILSELAVQLNLTRS